MYKNNADELKVIEVMISTANCSLVWLFSTKLSLYAEIDQIYRQLLLGSVA